MNYRKLGRILFALMALTTLTGSLITFFDQAGLDRRPLQSIAMAILTLTFVEAIRCLDD